MPITINAVTPHSLCATHGVLPGDLLCAINGHPICDGLDYNFYATQRRVRLELERNSAPYVLTFTKGEIIYEVGKTTSELSDRISADLYKRGMRFVGSVIIYSYLQAVGFIYSHDEECFMYKK